MSPTRTSLRKFILPAALALLLALALSGGFARAWTSNTVACDFVTGGGWILHNGAHANFGVAGGVKNGAFWGHLEYNDHGFAPPLQVPWTGAAPDISLDN